MDTNARLRQLAGLPLMEAEEKKKKASDAICPFCGTVVPHGKLIAHIKSHHADLIEYYNKMEKKDDKEDK